MGNLTPLKGAVRRREFLTADIESKDGDSPTRAGFTRPFQTGVYDGSRYYCFFDKPEAKARHWESRSYQEGGNVDRAMRFMLQHKFRGMHIYFHNGGRFDFLHLMPWLETIGKELGYQWSIIPVASAIQVLDVWKGKNRKHVWRFLDSVKLIPAALDKIAKSFGVDGKLTHDLNVHEDKQAEWYAYNKQDCVALYTVLERFHDYIENVLCGEVGITAPSTSVKLLRRRYLKRELPRTEESHTFIREGYFGGRVEVFRSYGENLRYYDINSSYPAAMLEDMPGGLGQYWKGEPPARLRSNSIGFVRCKVFIPEMFIPPLPIRSDGSQCPKGKLIFPVGRLEGVWEWSELQNAMKYGAEIVDWGDSWWYEPVQIFGKFVRDLYHYRDKSNPEYDEALASVVKILLNSTYGKFGMKTERRQLYQAGDPEMPENATPLDGTPDSPVWVAEKTVDAPYVMPQIAARVTALGRVRLHRYMMEADKGDETLCYCDTDSLITPNWMPSTTELGGLKDELPEHSGKLKGEFLGPKLYMIGNPDENFEWVKAKGIQTKTREIVERLASGQTITMSRLEKVGTLARAGFARGPRVVTVPRTMRQDAGKRQSFDDGSTAPYKLEMF